MNYIRKRKIWYEVTVMECDEITKFLWWCGWNDGKWTTNPTPPFSSHARLNTFKSAYRCMENAFARGATVVCITRRWRKKGMRYETDYIYDK